MADVKRNLEAGGGLYISRFWTGLYQNRSPLYTPMSAMGVQLIMRQDALWDGLNMQITPQFTLRRRYGFLRFCPTAFGGSEFPLDFFSFENLSGTITPIVDTQSGVYSFTSSGKTLIYSKTTTTQSSFVDVGNILYWCDGSVAKKWDGTTVSNMGIVAPTTAPSTSIAGGTLSILIGVQWGYVFRDSNSGAVSTMSPATTSTGPLNSTVIETTTVPATGPYTYTVVDSSTWCLNTSVVYVSSGLPLALVSGTPTTGQYNAAAGVYTFASGDASQQVTVTYQTGSAITLSGAGSTNPEVTNVDIYRTDDGGADFYYDATVSNPGSGTWNYTDQTPDASLNDDIIAPVADANNPPPAGMSLLTWYGGRLWGASGNTLYYSGGPDTTNGVGEESWPPGNNFTLPGNITAFAPTSSGLIIWTRDDAWITLGNTSATFTVPQPWQSNWGVPNQNCVAQDGDNLFIFTSQAQVFNYNATNGLEEIGFLEEEQLGAFTPSDSYIVVHRSGPDEGVFVCDGSANIYRYSQVSTSWDTVIQPVGGVGAIASIELEDGDWRLVTGRPTGSGYVLERDLNTWSDDGSTYSCWATIGSLTVAPPRQVANIASVLLQVMAVGTYPTLSVMVNEIEDLGKLPATFITLPNPVPDPPQLPPSQSIWTKRHDFKAAQTPLSGHVAHMQIKIAFPSEAQPNELLGVGLA